MKTITSAQNSTFKLLKALKQRKHRQKEQLFMLEGFRYVDDALSYEREYFGIFFDEITWVSMLDEAKKQYQNIENLYILSSDLFEQLAETETAQGIIGVFKMLAKTIEDLSAELSPFIIYLDRLQDPGNLGTVIRTADAAGIKDIIINKGCVDVYNSKVIRSTAGSLLNVNLVFADSDETAFDELKQKGYHMVVSDLKSDYDYADPNAYRDFNCLVIGNEGNGISDTVRSRADVKVKIPIYGKAESLNASVAAGILIYKIRDLYND